MTIEQNMYKQDFYAWTMQQADLLKQKKFEQIDLENIIEEIETLGRSEHRELSSRMKVLVMHLLKWQFQSDRSGTSWERTIREQRKEIKRAIDDMPSLILHLQDNEWLKKIWGRAVVDTADETNLKQSIFPSEPIWTVETILSEDFYPTKS